MVACQSCTHLHLPKFLLPWLKMSMIFLFLRLQAAPLSFNYERFHKNDATLKFEGDVYQDNMVLQLTKPQKDSLGRVIYYRPMHLWDKNSGKVADFTTLFKFIINSPNRTYDGDGMTFLLSRPNFSLPVPRDGSGIGLVSRAQIEDATYTNENPFVAVEFDTFRNVWDPPYDHVGIDINTVKTALTTEWLSVKDGIYDVNITYTSSTQNLSIFFTGYQKNISIQQHYSYIINFKDVLPELVEIGFSSATGWFYSIHTLCSWSFTSTSLEDVQLPPRRRNMGFTIGMSIGGGVLACLLSLTGLLIWKKKRGKGDNFEAELNMDEDFERGTGAKRFSYKELVRATSNFAEEQKLGEGGFGGVYRGFLRDMNSDVAVKRVSRGSKQGTKEYASEVKIISRLRHRNLVQLIGWCHEKKDLMLIYEFMENGSLDSHLHKGKSLLTWKMRYGIARGLASALLYLHEEWEQCVFHRDIKSSNVMLDSKFNAKLGDFGLARLVDHGKRSQTTVLAGTLGYMAPEYATNGKATKKSDVYSFGIVILEIACGRRPVESNAEEERVIMVEWVWELYGMGNVLEAADPRLLGDFDEEEAYRLMIIGLWCAYPDYLLRPTIKQAIHVLNNEAPLPNLPSRMPIPSYVPPPASSMASASSSFHITTSEISQNHSSSNYSSHTGSSQSHITSASTSPSAALLHTQ